MMDLISAVVQLFLWTWAVVTFVAGGLILASSQSAIHETVAGLVLLIGTVAVGSAAVVNEIQNLRRDLLKDQPTKHREGHLQTDGTRRDFREEIKELRDKLHQNEPPA